MRAAAWIALIVLSTGFSGCFDGEDAKPQNLDGDRGPARDFSGGTAAFRCASADDPCRETVLDQRLTSVRRSLQDPDRLLGVSNIGLVDVTFVGFYTRGMSFFHSEDGVAWQELPVPSVPLATGELQSRIFGVDLMQDPTGALHALFAVNVVPAFIKGEIELPESYDFLAYAVAPDGRNWQPAKRFLDGLSPADPTLHWAEGEAWASWNGNDGRHFSSVEHINSEAPLVKERCVRPRPVEYAGQFFIPCDPDDWPRDYNFVRLAIVTPDRTGSFEVASAMVHKNAALAATDEGVWAVDGFEAIRFSWFNGTAMVPQFEIPFDAVESLSVPNFQEEDFEVLAASQDDAGLWHVLAVARRQGATAEAPSQLWLVSLTINPDGTLQNDRVIADTDATSFFHPNYPIPEGAWLFSIGMETVAIERYYGPLHGRTASYWIDTTPNQSEA